MNIVEALRKYDNQAMLFYGPRWLCSDTDGSWIVYEQLPYERKPKILTSTHDESLAVKFVLGEE